MFKHMSKKFDFPIYDGEGGGEGGGGEGGGGEGGKGEGGKGGEKEFSQTQVDSMMAKQKRVLQEKNTGLMAEIEALNTKATLTSDEMKKLETASAALRKANMSDKQLNEEAANKVRNDFETKIAGLEGDVDKWKGRHTKSTIERAIIDAASIPAQKAVVPKQVLAILKPDTHLVESVDDDGKPTGEFTPKVTFMDTKDGKPVTLVLTPNEAVKRMSEMDEHLNLFEGKGSGGMGSSNKGGSGSGKTMTHAEAAKHFKDNPAGYKEWKTKNPL